jgi:hypothetical protein
MRMVRAMCHPTSSKVLYNGWLLSVLCWGVVVGYPLLQYVNSMKGKLEF